MIAFFVADGVFGRCHLGAGLCRSWALYGVSADSGNIAVGISAAKTANCLAIKLVLDNTLDLRNFFAFWMLVLWHIVQLDVVEHFNFNRFFVELASFESALPKVGKCRLPPFRTVPSRY